MIKLHRNARPRHPMRRNNIVPLPDPHPRRIVERVCAVSILAVLVVAAFDFLSGWL